MMRILLLMVLVLVASVSVALLVMKDPGYVLLSYGNYTLETTLSFFGLVLLLAVYGIYLTMHTLGSIWWLPERLFKWQHQRQIQHAREGLCSGLTELAQGNWRTAERRLLRYVRHSETPLLNYLGAARAAQHQGSLERRDRYLSLAHEQAASTAAAVELAQAELQIDSGQREQALATLELLKGRDSDNPYLLKLIAGLYEQLNDWDRLRDLLPALLKHQVLDKTDMADKELEVIQNQIQLAARSKKRGALQQVWESVPDSLQYNEALLLEYGRQLMLQNAGDEAVTLVARALSQHWSEGLVHLFGLLPGSDPERQLAIAAAWTREHGRDPILQLSLGRLSLRNRQWGKARIYLETSISLLPRAETYKELGILLEHLGDQDAARNCFREGVLLAVNSPAFQFPDDLDTVAEADEPIESSSKKLPPLDYAQDK